jgi:DNA-binding transcriptional ArsR family regulator
MPITVQLPATPAACLTFAYSPAMEALLSLHVLVEPKHHPLQHPWVRRMHRLSPSLKREIGALAFAYRYYFPAFFHPAGGEGGDFDGELTQLRAVDPFQAREEFSVAFLGQVARGRPFEEHADLLGRLLDRTSAENPRRSLVAMTADDPGRMVERLVDLLEAYWTEAFGQEWERIEPLLAEGVSVAGRQIAERGVYRFLSGLRPDVLVDSSRRQFRLARPPHDHDLSLGPEDQFVLTPSMYVWPHTRINCDRPWPLGLVFPAPFLIRDPRPVVPPAELVGLLRALGDEARLRILYYIAERPRSTQELAPLVGISEGALSKHLRALSAAGVISGHREGYYVLYRLVPERLGGLHRGLADFLMADPGTDFLYPQ